MVFLQKRVRVSFFKYGLGFRFEFGFGKLIGGAVGTVGWVSRKPPVLFLVPHTCPSKRVSRLNCSVDPLGIVLCKHFYRPKVLK